MDLKTAFDIKDRELISIIGAGGKTSLMFALAQELSSPEKLVISTTTTKILFPEVADTPLVLFASEQPNLLDVIEKKRRQYNHITVVSEKLANHSKLVGISPCVVEEIFAHTSVSHIINEADGAAHRSLKAPRLPDEPVIPSATTLVIAVVGADVFGTRFTEENVFRSEIASQLTGLTIGTTLSIDAIARLLIHPQGILANSPENARIVFFINKVELEGALESSRALGQQILKSTHYEIQKVVLGQLHNSKPVVEIIKNKRLK